MTKDALAPIRHAPAPLPHPMATPMAVATRRVPPAPAGSATKKRPRPSQDGSRSTTRTSIPSLTWRATMAVPMPAAGSPGQDRQAALTGAATHVDASCESSFTRTPGRPRVGEPVDTPEATCGNRRCGRFQASICQLPSRRPHSRRGRTTRAFMAVAGRIAGGMLRFAGRRESGRARCTAAGSGPRGVGVLPRPHSPHNSSRS
jgi:hypothetical protein